MYPCACTTGTRKCKKVTMRKCKMQQIENVTMRKSDNATMRKSNNARKRNCEETTKLTSSSLCVFAFLYFERKKAKIRQVECEYTTDFMSYCRPPSFVFSLCCLENSKNRKHERTTKSLRVLAF
jgi:hypothetical protein